MSDREGSRKRANVACSLCRRRKRRCDGLVPCCTLCQNSGVSCVYDDTEAHKTKSNASSSQIHERLGNLETLLEKHAKTLEKLTQPQTQNIPITPIPGPPSDFIDPAFSSAFSPFAAGNWTSFTQANVRPDAASPALSFGRELPPMVIPRGHSTTTESLLASEPVKAILGDFPANLFVTKEAGRGWPGGPLMTQEALSLHHLPTISRESSQGFIDSYFGNAHPEYPVLDRGMVFALQERILDSGVQRDADSALYLMILAVGCIAAQPLNIHDTPTESEHPSFQYTTPALRILCQEAINTFGTTLTVAQGLFLAAKFYGYLLRPLQSWRFVHLASTNIQHLCNQEPDPDWTNSNNIALTAWAIFDTECDLIAEHQLPRSGIEHVVDAMPLPKCYDQNSDATLSFLAELSARRLLNRVHHAVYDNNSTALSMRISSPATQAEPYVQQPVPAVMRVSSELDRQLDVWFSLLPMTIQPDLQDETSWGVHQVNLLHRYHSAKDIIFRPFVMYAWTLPQGQQLPNQVMECCRTCVLACRSYLSVSTAALDGFRSNREIVIHSILAVTIVLSLSCLCPLLEHLVRDIGQLHQIAISAVEKWAFAGSSVEDILAILRLLQAKVQILKARRGRS